MIPLLLLSLLRPSQTQMYLIFGVSLALGLATVVFRINPFSWLDGMDAFERINYLYQSYTTDAGRNLKGVVGVVAAPTLLCLACIGMKIRNRYVMLFFWGCVLQNVMLQQPIAQRYCAPALLVATILVAEIVRRRPRNSAATTIAVGYVAFASLLFFYLLLGTAKTAGMRELNLVVPYKVYSREVGEP